MKERIFNYPHPERKQMPTLVDFDGTIAKSVWPDRGIGEPLDGAREAIDELRNKHGKKIVVYTARASYEARAVWRWLIDNGIMADEVKTGKESGHFYIGDEAIPFRGSWEDVIADAKKSFLK